MNKYFPNDISIDNENLKGIAELLINRENITTVWLPGSGRTISANRLKEKDALRAFIPDKLLNNYIFIYLDLSLSQHFFEKQLDESLGLYSSEHNIRNKLDKLVKENKEIIFLIDNFNLKNSDLVKYIFSLRHVNIDKIRFLLITLESDFNAIKDIREDYSLIFHNIIQIPFISELEIKEWIKINADEVNAKLTIEDIKMIYQYCGGIPALVKSMIRGIKRYQTFEKAKQSQEFKNTASTLWQRFSQREQFVFKNLIFLNKLPPYTLEINYLKNHLLVDKNNKIIGGWMSDIIGNKNEILIKKVEGHYVWNEMNIDEAFSNIEKTILDHLFICKDFIKKEDMAKIIWGEQLKGYSDWALDKTFSRIRKKLDKIGIGGEIIKTFRGRGYILKNVVVK